jgi:hypothetical protein
MDLAVTVGTKNLKVREVVVRPISILVVDVKNLGHFDVGTDFARIPGTFKGRDSVTAIDGVPTVLPMLLLVFEIGCVPFPKLRSTFSPMLVVAEPTKFIETISIPLCVLLRVARGT